MRQTRIFRLNIGISPWRISCVYHHIYIDSPDKNILKKAKNCKKEYYILKTALHQKILENAHFDRITQILEKI